MSPPCSAGWITGPVLSRGPFRFLADIGHSRHGTAAGEGDEEDGARHWVQVVTLVEGRGAPPEDKRTWVLRNQTHFEARQGQGSDAAEQSEDAADVGPGLGVGRDAVAGFDGAGAGVVAGEG
jgi:hypothetical protein